MFLIWSNDRRGWWLRSRYGYTTNIEEAGRFTFAEARQIELEAFAGGMVRWTDADNMSYAFPPEVIVLAPEA